MKALIKIFIFLFLVFNLHSAANLKAKYLEVDYKNNIWILRNDVTLNTSKYILKADEFTYFRNDKKFLANKNIYIFFYKEKRKIYGESLSKDQNRKIIQGTPQKPLKVIDKEGKRIITAKILDIKEDKDKNISKRKICTHCNFR